MINAQDIKIGTCIRMDGKLYFCIDFLHVKPGKGNTFMRTKLKDVVNGYVLERRFNIGEKLEDVRVERRPHQYLYHDGDNYQFMNQETFDQIPIAHDLLNHPDARTLAGIIVSLGLVQNLAALKALTSTGIQAGHMKLQAKSLALLAGANPEEMPHVLSELLKAKHMNQETAQAILEKLRNP